MGRDGGVTRVSWAFRRLASQRVAPRGVGAMLDVKMRPKSRNNPSLGPRAEASLCPATALKGAQVGS